MIRPRFSALILKDNLVTEEQVVSALQTQAQSGELIGSIFYKQRILTEEQVLKYLSKVYEIPGVYIERLQIDVKMREVIPREIALKYIILPLKVENRVLHLACVFPNQLSMIQEVEFMTNCRVRPYIAMQCKLRERIHLFYSTGHQAIDISLSPSEEKASEINITSLAESFVGDIAKELETRDLAQAKKLAQPQVPLVQPDWKNLQQRKSTVLVIDDDRSICDMLSDFLKSKGYNVVTATNGREGVQRIQSLRPHLIVLDAMLPGIHGFTICRTLKGSEKYRNIPVLMVSAIHTGWRFRMDVKEQYGADDFIAKPFKLEELLSHIKILLDESMSQPTPSEEKEQLLTAQAEDLLARGMEAFKQKNFKEAQEFFEQGIAVDQFHPLLHYNQGKCREMLNDPFSAMAALEKSIELDPDLFPAIKDLAILYQKNGFKRKAIEMWGHAIAIAPDDAIKSKMKEVLFKLL